MKQWCKVLMVSPPKINKAGPLLIVIQTFAMREETVTNAPVDIAPKGKTMWVAMTAMGRWCSPPRFWNKILHCWLKMTVPKLDWGLLMPHILSHDGSVGWGCGLEGGDSTADLGPPNTSFEPTDEAQQNSWVTHRRTDLAIKISVN